MPTVKIQDATSEPVSLTDVKLALRIDDTDRDALLLGYISAARQELEGLLLRTLITTTWEWQADRFPAACQPALRLHWPRVLQVISVSYLPPVIDPQAPPAAVVLPGTAYTLDAASEPGLLWPAYGTQWPNTRCDVAAVRVRYTAGFGDTAAAVPQPLRTWILLRVQQLDQGCADEHTDMMSRSLLLANYKVYAV